MLISSHNVTPTARNTCVMAPAGITGCVLMAVTICDFAQKDNISRIL